MKLRFAFVALLLLASFIRADGVIIPIHPEDQYPLILNHYVTVTINDTYAFTRVEQEFRNDGYRDMEGTYMFPVPQGGIRDVKLIVGNKTLEGRVLGSDEAKKTYEQYVIERKDASLLEYVGRDAFSSSVVLPRGQTVKVIITYDQIIPSSGGLYTYMYPLSPERYSTKPIDPVNITINITAPGTIGFIYSPTHNITVQRAGNSSAVATYYEEKVIPNRDFQLYYGVTDREYDVQLLAQKSGNDGYFLLFVYPSIVNQSPIPKDVIFLADTSGSMEGTKLQQSQKALKYGLDKLNEDDRFDVIAFSGTPTTFSGSLTGVSSISNAKAFVNNLVAEGSTNLQDSLSAATSEFQNDSRLHIVVLLTDGVDTTGHSRESIMKSLEGKENFKIFVFGVGSDADFELLDKLANSFGDGIPTYIKNDADLEMTLKSFYDRIATPLLSNVQLSFEGMAGCPSSGNCVKGPIIYDTLPKKIPDVFLGTQLVIAGRYNESGQALVTLRGSIAGVDKELTYNVNFPETASNNFVERTWALRKVGYLLDQIALEGETPELKQEVTALATKYGIPTPYTSYLVVSSEGNVISRDIGTQTMATTTAGGSFGVTNAYKGAGVLAPASVEVPDVKVVNDKTFVAVGGIWKDTSCGDKQPTQTVSFGSDEYFNLSDNREIVNYLSVGDNAILCNGSDVIMITPYTQPYNSTSSQGSTTPQATGQENKSAAPQTGEVPPNLSSLAWIPAGAVLILLAFFTALNMLKRHPEAREVDESGLYRALSSDTRMDILNTLLEGERTPTDISSKLNKSKATIVEHLDKLREADLVEKIEVDGRKWVFYKLTPRGKSIVKKGG